MNTRRSRSRSRRRGDRGQRDQRPGRRAGSERPPVELVQSVGGHADREEEGGKRGEQAIEVDRRRRRRAERDVATGARAVYGGCRRVDEVAPAAGRERVEGGAHAQRSASQRRPPDHDPAAEAHHAARPPTRFPLARQSSSCRRSGCARRSLDARPQEAADLVPIP